MATYRSYRYATSRSLLWASPFLVALGAWFIFERIHGIALVVGDRNGRSHLMSLSEQTVAGLFFVATALLIPLLAWPVLNRRVEWDGLRISFYDGRNRVRFDESISDLLRLTHELDDLNRGRYTVYGTRGSFVFPESWRDSAELAKRINEAVSTNEANRRAHPAPP